MTSAEFGATPWGRAWVRVVEPTTGLPNPLLPKARGLARNHAVTLSVGTGRVDGTVVAAGTTHTVRLDVPPWSAAEQATVRRLLAEAEVGHRCLAVGDLPDALEAELRRHCIAVAVRSGEQVGSCDCRTRRRPCVHLLATVYALAQLVDERPAVVLDLRLPGASVTAGGSTDWIALTDLEVAGFYGD